MSRGARSSSTKNYEHGQIIGRIFFEIYSYFLKIQNTTYSVSMDIDTSLTETYEEYMSKRKENLKYKGQFKRPDLFIISSEDIVHDGKVFGVPEMIIEVASPSTINEDYGDKKSIYESSRVPEYWIVNPEGVVDVFLLQNGKYELYQYIRDFLYDPTNPMQIPISAGIPVKSFEGLKILPFR